MIDRLVIDRLEATPIEGVAERLGLRVEHHKCLCPFHDDSRPSLTFNTYRNRYRCYVCDAHGGVIDLVKGVKSVGFREACAWLTGSPFPAADAAPGSSMRSADSAPAGLTLGQPSRGCPSSQVAIAKGKGKNTSVKQYPPDIEWLSQLIRVKSLNKEARHFLFEERHIDPRVVAWCGLTSISTPQPCWRYGKPFYDAPSLLIPYYDVDGRLVSVQSRYLKPLSPSASGVPGSSMRSADSAPAGLTLGQPSRGCPSSQDASLRAREEAGPIPRFKFPRGSDCHVYGLQILRMLRPGEELWITEGASDCWAMLSSGKKAIAIPSATLLKENDIEPLRRVIAPPSAGGLGGSLHMYPDQDRPGEKLFLELREKLSPYTGGVGEGLQRHQLPEGCKDFGDYWKKLNVKS